MTLGIAAAWVALCLALYLDNVIPGFPWPWVAEFWNLPPATTGQIAAALRQHAGSAAAAAAVVLAAGGAAPAVIRWCGGGKPARPGAFPLAVGLTLVLPAIALGLGLAGLFRPGMFIALSSGLALLALASLAAGLRAGGPVFLAGRARAWLSPAAPGPSRRGRMGPPLAAVALLLPPLLCALAPQTQYDALQYHLSLPAQFLRHGLMPAGAEPLPYSALPLAGDLLFAWGMALGGDGAAQIVNWLMLPLALLLVAGAARGLRFPPFLAAAAWLLLAASPLVSVLAAQAFTDMFPLAAIAAALHLKLSGRPSRSALLFGLCLGAAGGAKLGAGGLAACVLIPLAPRRGRLLAATGWVLPQAAWGLRAYLATGSPLGGVILSSWFPAFYQSEETLSLSRAAVWVGTAHPSLWLWFPSYLLREAVSAGHELSPLMVAALPGLLLAPLRGTPPVVRSLAVSAVASYLLWALAGGGQVRYLVPALPLIVLGSLAPPWFWLERNRAELARSLVPRVVVAAVALAVAVGYLRSTAALYRLVNPLSVVLGSMSPRAYLASVVTPRFSYVSVASFLEERPDLGRPYLAGDIKDYYWPRDPVLDSQYLRPRLVKWMSESPDERAVLAKFRQHRIGCLVHWPDGSLAVQGMVGGYPWTDRQLGLLQRFMYRHLSPLDLAGRAEEDYRLWRLSPAPLPAPGVPRLRGWRLPYTEMLHFGADALLEDGRIAEAEREYRELAARYPSFAIPLLRLAEVARRRGDASAQRRYERAALRLLEP